GVVRGPVGAGDDRADGRAPETVARGGGRRARAEDLGAADPGGRGGAPLAGGGAGEEDGVSPGAMPSRAVRGASGACAVGDRRGAGGRAVVLRRAGGAGECDGASPPGAGRGPRGARGTPRGALDRDGGGAARDSQGRRRLRTPRPQLPPRAPRLHARRLQSLRTPGLETARRVLPEPRPPHRRAGPRGGGDP